MDLQIIADNIQTEITELNEKLAQKKLSIGEADSAKESRFPSGRTELELEISLIEGKILERKALYRAITEGRKYREEVVKAGVLVQVDIQDAIMEYYLVDGEGDINLGILSMQSPLGQAIKGKKLAETAEFNESLVTIVKIF